MRCSSTYGDTPVRFRLARSLTAGDHFPMTSQSPDEAFPPAETPAPGAQAAPQPPPATVDPSGSVTRATRISGTWIAVIVATILLVFLLIFILQNLTTVTVSFLGFSGNLPLGVALLFAAIVGALLVILVGAARILQLRRRVRRANSL
jgi:uncharacterized integral membrane protein